MELIFIYVGHSVKFVKQFLQVCKNAMKMRNYTKLSNTGLL